MNPRLTDMSNPDYSIQAEKAKYRSNRRNNIRAMRKEGDFNEDGELFKNPLIGILPNACYIT
jgi:hypothetical protein